MKLRAFTFSTLLGITLLAPQVQAEENKDAKKLDPEMVLARLDGKEFKLKDAAAMVQALGPQLAQVPLEKILPMMRDAWLQEQMYVSEAKKEKLQKSPEYKDALSKVKRQILMEVYLAKLSEKLVTETKLRAAYDEEVKKKYSDSNKKEVKIQFVELDSKSKAQEVIQLLKSNSIDFDQAVTKFSRNKENNGVLGYVSENTEGVIPQFIEAAMSLKKSGDITDKPLKIGKFFYVLRSLGDRKIEKPKFEELAPTLSRRVMGAEMKEHSAKLKKQYKVEEFPLPKLPTAKMPAS